LEFLYEYGLFLAKAITFIVSVGIILALVIGASQKNNRESEGSIDVTKINERYDDIKERIKSAVYSDEVLKQEAKAAKKNKKLEQKAEKKQLKLAAKENSEKESTKSDISEEKNKESKSKKRVYLIDFDGDIKASAVDSLREEITAILSLAREEDEVVVRLESAGGMVHSYGLASSQLARIKEKGIPLTVCVDKVAASGGYMMACVANTICAAPFAILGSIGVVAQLPNFHRLLKKNDVDFELFTAGEYKRTLTMFGENTDKGREKFTEDLETTHELFKDFVRSQRPIVDIDKVATGEIWFGSQAKEQELVDLLTTSDDYIISQVNKAEIYHVQYSTKKSFTERLGVNIQHGVEHSINKLLSTLNTSRFM
jgi:serine protease SohB